MYCYMSSDDLSWLQVPEQPERWRGGYLQQLRAGVTLLVRARQLHDQHVTLLGRLQH